MICLHGQGFSTLSRLIIKSKKDATSTPITNSNKKLQISTKGLLSMNYMKKNEGTGYLVLLYFNHLDILEVGKNPKGKGSHILTHK